MLSNNIVVLYHSNCTDGFGSAYAHYLSINTRLPLSYCKKQKSDIQVEHNYVFRIVDRLQEHNLHYIPVAYSQFKNKPPEYLLESVFKKYKSDEYKKTTVVILDFSFNRDTFKFLKDTFERVVMIDHHDTALREYKMEDSGESVIANDNWAICLDKKHSGAYLSYKYFELTLGSREFVTVLDSKIPLELKLIEDRDLWVFKYTCTDSFHEGLRAVLERNLDAWVEKLHNREEMNEVIEAGNYVLKYRDSICNESITQQAQTVNINYYINDQLVTEKAIAVNILPSLFSTTGSIICKTHNTNIALLWTTNKDGTIMCSLRSTNKFNTLPIAEYFGGGGHETASGFTISAEDFKKYIQSCKE